MMIADLALGAAPIAGGALFGVLAGNLKGPDYRGMLKADQDILQKIPPENVELRALLEASINRRVRALVVSTEKSRELIGVAASYKGNWRDIVLFVCAVLFTMVWWAVPHSRPNWLATFIFLIIVTVIVGIYAVRGIVRAVFGGRRHAEPNSTG